MSPPSSWRRHDIEPLRISVELLAELPVEDWQRLNGGGVWQSIAEPDDILFVHWGESASFEAFQQSLSDLLTRPIHVADRSTKVLGTPARQVSATVERGASVAYARDAAGELTHRETPAARSRMEALSFVRDDVPVLVGCRLAEASWHRHERTVKRFLASIRELGG